MEQDYHELLDCFFVGITKINNSVLIYMQKMVSSIHAPQPFHSFFHDSALKSQDQSSKSKASIN